MTHPTRQSSTPITAEGAVSRVTAFLAYRKRVLPNAADHIYGYNGNTPLLASDLEILITEVEKNNA